MLNWFIQRLNKVNSFNPRSEILYIAPLWEKSTPIVFTSILRSNPKCHSVMYFVSSLTTSSKSVISLLPLTCHMPVIPGLMASLARWWYSYFSHSSTVGGLVPTRDISPFRTLKNWGNSSPNVKWERRKKCKKIEPEMPWFKAFLALLRRSYYFLCLSMFTLRYKYLQKPSSSPTYLLLLEPSLYVFLSFKVSS